MASTASELARGRAAYAKLDWRNARERLSAADRVVALGPADLELLATAAYMLGQDDDHVELLERAHHGRLEAGEERRAAHCACWIGVNLALRREMAQASGWFGRAQRLLEGSEDDCAERGYLLFPAMLQAEAQGDSEGAYAAATRGLELGQRFDDRDLVAISLHVQGRARLSQGRLGEGLPLLDEAMVAVTAGELSPIVTGIVYCSVIEACQQVSDTGRAREWTDALSRWCEGQPDLVSFTGKCLMHRAEIMQASGEWREALAEARSASERFARDANARAEAHVVYRQGEILRLQGELAGAEAAFEEAARGGCEPQPGLALLRLAQGDGRAAAAAIRRALGQTSDRRGRTNLLPACVEVALAVGEIDEARSACAEIEELAEGADNDTLKATAAHARGAVALVEGDAWAALNALQRARRLWHELRMPYEAARSRVLVAQACRAVGDDDTAAIELEGARADLERLGAALDLARLERPVAPPAAGDGHGLTARELEVLGLLARGDTNRAIAAELVISERTVDRHVSNIFAKLRVSSRSAATAFAYEHRLV